MMKVENIDLRQRLIQSELAVRTLTEQLVIKNEYISITVNLYGKDYTGLIDYSSRYLKIGLPALDPPGLDREALRFATS